MRHTVDDLMPLLPVLLTLDQPIADTAIASEILRAACRKSQRVSLGMPAHSDITALAPLIQFFHRELSGHSLLLRTKFSNKPIEHIANYRSWGHETKLLDNGLHKQIRFIREITGADTRLAVELSLDENNCQRLFAQLQTALLHDPEFVLLNPHHLAPQKYGQTVREQLTLFATYAKEHVPVFFSPEHPLHEAWQVVSRNLLAGPRQVDIDLSDVCTHNCVFCSTQPEEAMTQKLIQKKSRRREELIFKIQEPTFDRIAADLPATTKMVQFGGMGDPFTHKNALDFIARIRACGIPFSTLTNFAYLNDSGVRKLHALTDSSLHSMQFTVNLSAATADTYCKVRPNQSEATFRRVISHLQLASDLCLQDGRGLNVWLLLVMNKLNFHEAPLFVALARDVGATSIWLRPVEIHDEHIARVKVPAESELEYARSIKQALYLADLLNIDVHQRDQNEAVVAEFAGQLAQAEEKLPLDQQIHQLAEAHPLLAKYLYQQKNCRPPARPILQKSHAQSQYLFSSVFDYSDAPKPAPTKATATPGIPRANASKPVTASETKNRSSLGILNADTPARYYDQHPCQIGYEYLRILASGAALPCCPSVYPLADSKDRSILEIWRSGSMQQFREAGAQMHVKRPHRHEPEWMFCQYCSHEQINRRRNAIDASWQNSQSETTLPTTQAPARPAETNCAAQNAHPKIEPTTFV